MKKIQKLFIEQVQKFKKTMVKNKPYMIGVILSVVMFVILLVQMGLIRAFVFTSILAAIYFTFLHFNSKKLSKKKQKTLKKKVLLGFLGLGIAGLLVMFLFVGIVVFTAPKFDPKNMDRNNASVLYDKDGELIAKLGLEKREKITYDEMPEVLVDAIIATEDSRFFEHNGFDLPRFLKASFGQAMGQAAGGASTLTMQVSKNNYTSLVADGFEGVKRKFTDIYLSIFQIERNYTKKEILEFYVNQPYLGSGAFGVEQACQTYFGKSAKDINLSEAALIAGLFQAPGAYDPFINPEKAEARRSNVLYLMNRHGYITKEEQELANNIPVTDLLTKKGISVDFQSFIDTVVEDVIATTGKDPYVVPMEIHTTMDRERQQYVNDIMSGKSFDWENEVVNTGIAVIDAKTGAIVAIGAGRNRVGQRQFNTATMTKRQIGSTAKPLYDYGPGIEYNNWSSYHLFVDEPHSYSGGTSIQNWDQRFQGLMTSRLALTLSRNIPALKAFQANKNKDVLEFAQNLGLSPEVTDNYLHEAHALGGYNGESPLSMAAAYAAFSNKGYYTKPYSFTKIVYVDEDDEFINKPKKERAMSEETAYIMSDMLVDTTKHALGRYSSISGVNFGAKSGTSNFSSATVKQFKLPSNAINDLWVVGSSPDYAISVWYGYNKIDPNNITRNTSMQHAKLFQTLGKGIFIKGSNFEKADGVIEVAIEKETWPAMLPSSNTPSNMIIKELFKKGTEPTEASPRYASLANPSNVKVTMVGNKAMLNWDAISTPSGFDIEVLNKYFSSLYRTSGTRSSALNSRLEYNRTVMGTVGYNVYKELSDGSLQLVGFTTNNGYEVDAKDASAIVVKSTYSIFGAASSDGVRTAISYVPEPDKISAFLNGSREITLTVNEDYADAGVTVMEDGEDVTSLARPSYTVTPAVYLENITDKAGTYKITYNVSYKSFSKTLSRTINVVNQ